MAGSDLATVVTDIEKRLKGLEGSDKKPDFIGTITFTGDNNGFPFFKDF